MYIMHSSVSLRYLLACILTVLGTFAIQKGLPYSAELSISVIFNTFGLFLVPFKIPVYPMHSKYFLRYLLDTVMYFGLKRLSVPSSATGGEY